MSGFFVFAGVQKAPFLKKLIFYTKSILSIWLLCYFHLIGCLEIAAVCAKNTHKNGILVKTGTDFTDSVSKIPLLLTKESGIM